MNHCEICGTDTDSGQEREVVSTPDGPNYVGPVLPSDETGPHCTQDAWVCSDCCSE